MFLLVSSDFCTTLHNDMLPKIMLISKYTHCVNLNPYLFTIWQTIPTHRQKFGPARFEPFLRRTTEKVIFLHRHNQTTCRPSLTHIHCHSRFTCVYEYELRVAVCSEASNFETRPTGYPVNVAGGIDNRLLSFPSKVVIQTIIINPKEQNPS